MWNDRSCDKGNKILLIETIVAVVIADGLSRFASSRAYNIEPNVRDCSLQASVELEIDPDALLKGKQAVKLPPPPYRDIVIQEMVITIDGYAHDALSIFDYLSTAVIVLYMLVATLHTIWIHL